MEKNLAPHPKCAHAAFAARARAESALAKHAAVGAASANGVDGPGPASPSTGALFASFSKKEVPRRDKAGQPHLFSRTSGTPPSYDGLHQRPAFCFFIHLSPLLPFRFTFTQ